MVIILHCNSLLYGANLPDDKMARGEGFGGSSKQLLESPPSSKATSASLSRQESGKYSLSPKANRASNISPLEDLDFLLDANLFKANQSQRPTSAGNEPFLMGAKATPIGDPFGSPAESPASSANNHHHKKPQISAGTDGNVTTSPRLSSRFPSEVKSFESNDGMAAPCLVYGVYTYTFPPFEHSIIIVCTVV